MMRSNKHKHGILNKPTTNNNKTNQQLTMIYGESTMLDSQKTYCLSWSGPRMEIWGSQTIYGQIFSVRSFLEGSRELGIAWTNQICLQCWNMGERVGNRPKKSNFESSQNELAYIRKCSRIRRECFARVPGLPRAIWWKNQKSRILEN